MDDILLVGVVMVRHIMGISSWHDSLLSLVEKVWGI